MSTLYPYLSKLSFNCYFCGHQVLEEVSLCNFCQASYENEKCSTCYGKARADHNLSYHTSIDLSWTSQAQDGKSLLNNLEVFVLTVESIKLSVSNTCGFFLTKEMFIHSNVATVDIISNVGRRWEWGFLAGEKMNNSNACANCNRTLSQLSKIFKQQKPKIVPLHSQCGICAIKFWCCSNCFEFLSSNRTFGKHSVKHGLLMNHGIKHII